MYQLVPFEDGHEKKQLQWRHSRDEAFEPVFARSFNGAEDYSVIDARLLPSPGGKLAASRHLWIRARSEGYTEVLSFWTSVFHTTSQQLQKSCLV
jgi:hypothetical protein